MLFELNSIVFFVKSLKPPPCSFNTLKHVAHSLPVTNCLAHWQIILQQTSLSLPPIDKQLKQFWGVTSSYTLTLNLCIHFTTGPLSQVFILSSPYHLQLITCTLPIANLQWVDSCFSQHNFLFLLCVIVTTGTNNLISETVPNIKRKVLWPFWFPEGSQTRRAPIEWKRN